MTVAFFFNYLNRHQLPVADEMYQMLGDDFKFVITYPVDTNELKGGDDYSNRPYCLLPCQNENHKHKAITLNLESDVCLYGAGNLYWEKERAKTNKLSFEVSERWLKRGLINYFSPRLIKWWQLYQTKLKRASFYKLCCGAYVSKDCKNLLTFRNKCYKWGYFTELYNYDLEKLLNSKSNDTIRILWVSRFIPLKHPELLIKLAKKLILKQYNFEITMIGEGPLLQAIQNNIEFYNLKKYFRLTGNIPHTEVRKEMEKSDIFLFTSNKLEGWGAVLNEAMNSGCAVIANQKIGSVPYLIQDGFSGLVYDGTIDDLVERVELLINNPNLRRSLSINAYKTIQDYWNPRNAANSLLRLIDDLKNNRDSSIQYGPCSKA